MGEFAAEVVGEAREGGVDLFECAGLYFALALELLK